MAEMAGGPSEREINVKLLTAASSSCLITNTQWGGGSQGCRGFTAGFIARFGVGKKLRGTSDDMPCDGRGKSFHAVVQLRFFSEEALQK